MNVIDPRLATELCHSYLNWPFQARRSAAALKSHLDSIPMEAWPHAERHLRERLASWQYVEISGRSRKAIQRMPSLHKLGHTSVAAFGVLSFFPDGHVREQAVRHLCAIDSGEELPFLLLRVNDWVSVIHEAAEAGVLTRLLPTYTRHFVAALDLVQHLQRAQRHSHANLIAGVMALLASAPVEELVGAMEGGSRQKRRCAARILLGRSDLPGEIFGRILDDADPSVRTIAIEGAPGHLRDDDLVSLLTRRAGDRSVVVRRSALRVLSQTNFEAAHPLLVQHLLDRNRSVRLMCGNVLLAKAPMDFRAHYIDAISSATEGPTEAAIMGLGDYGTRGDVGLLLPFTSSPTSRVRAAAIQSVSALDTEHHLELFFRAIDDPSAAVQRVACGALLRAAAHLRLEDVIRTFCQTHPSPRMKLIRLARHLPKWDRIEFVLRTLPNSNADEQVMLEESVRRWVAQFNRAWVPVSKERLAELRRMLANAALHVSESMEARLAFYLT